MLFLFINEDSKHLFVNLYITNKGCKDSPVFINLIRSSFTKHGSTLICINICSQIQCNPYTVPYSNSTDFFTIASSILLVSSDLCMTLLLTLIASTDLELNLKSMFWFECFWEEYDKKIINKQNKILLKIGVGLQFLSGEKY